MEIGDKGGEAKIYGNLGTVSHSLGEYQKSKEFHEIALAINMEIGDRGAEVTNYGNLGTVLDSLGEYQKAKEFHEKALAINMEIGDKGGEARNYGNLGNVLKSIGEFQKANEFHKKALAINVEIGDKKGEARNYGNLGNMFESFGEHQKAEVFHEKALDIYRKIGDKNGEAGSYGNLGNVLRSLGEHQTAKEYLEKSLAINIEIGDKKGEATNYGNLGNVFILIGECQKAKVNYEKALSINMKIGNKKGEASNYRDLGNVFNALGEYQKAEEYLEKALAIATEIGDTEGEARIYENLGGALTTLGEYHKARDYHMKALAISIETGDKSGQAHCHLKIGLAWIGLGKYREAKKFGEKALSIATEIGDRESQAQAFGVLGKVSEWLHDHQKAKEHYKKQLTISSEIGHRKTVAEGYQRLGKVSLKIGEYDRADEYLEKARVISCDVGDIMSEFHTLLSLSVLRILQSKTRAAFSYLLQCMAKYETLRDFQQGNEQFQLVLLQVHGTSFYKLLGSQLCSAGNLRGAIYVEELQRARCLADLMARNFSVENHISADPKSWFGMEEIVSKERSSVFLYILYDDRRVYLWVLKTNGDILFRISEAVDDESLIAENSFNLDSFFNRVENCERRLQLCFKMIIAPVADQLTEPKIIIIPERSLYRVPFAALRDQEGRKCLAETFRIRIVPSLTTLKVIQDCPADYHSQTDALVVGDPKVGDARYRGKIYNFTSLAGAREEAEVIGKLLGVQPLLGERATREAVLQAMNSVSLIHIVAHGNVERGEIALSPRPSSSIIPEEEDYLLRISDILNAKLRAKLVVLSCCHSGRGEIKAEGVIGIARAFLASGARSVLVTLWAIEDEATKQFMGRFYRHLVDGESVSECLHQAMKWLRDIGFTEVRQWAPFMLIGDNVTFDFGEKKLVLFPRI